MVKRRRYKFGKQGVRHRRRHVLLEVGFQVVRTRRPTGTTVGTNRRVLRLLLSVD